MTPTRYLTGSNVEGGQKWPLFSAAKIAGWNSLLSAAMSFDVTLARGFIGRNTYVSTTMASGAGSAWIAGLILVPARNGALPALIDSLPGAYELGRTTPIGETGLRSRTGTSWYARLTCEADRVVPTPLSTASFGSKPMGSRSRRDSSCTTSTESRRTTVLKTSWRCLGITTTTILAKPYDLTRLVSRLWRSTSEASGTNRQSVNCPRWRNHTLISQCVPVLAPTS